MFYHVKIFDDADEPSSYNVPRELIDPRDPVKVKNWKFATSIHFKATKYTNPIAVFKYLEDQQKPGGECKSKYPVDVMCASL